MDFAVPGNHSGKIKESEKRDTFLNLAGELSKLWYMWVTVIPIVTAGFWTVPKGLIGAGRIRNQRTNRDHPNYIIVKIGKNTEKSPGDLRRLVIIDTPVKDHLLMMV